MIMRSRNSEITSSVNALSDYLSQFTKDQNRILNTIVASLSFLVAMPA